jgi:REP element-mobilizing transposase RayT
MGRNYTPLFVHLVWATWDRAPLIHGPLQRPLYRVMESEARALRCRVLGMNGMPDHVHVLLSLPTTVTIARLVQQMKGVSSHWVNERQVASAPFRWQGSYGAFTVSRWDLDRIAEYIRRQPIHHRDGRLVAELEDVNA